MSISEYITISGGDIFKWVGNAVKTNHVHWKNLKCNTTDCDKITCGKSKDVDALVSKAVENDGCPKQWTVKWLNMSKV